MYIEFPMSQFQSSLRGQLVMHIFPALSEGYLKWPDGQKRLRFLTAFTTRKN